jgi:hypothetical protein
MNDAELDARLTSLLRDDSAARPSDGFADRIMALAAYDLSQRQWRRRTVARIGRETLGLVAVLVVFAVMARMAPNSGAPADILPLASPAMVGVVMLAMWSVASLSPARR